MCADLRGNGQSDCPGSDDEHLPYSKRVRAAELIEEMASPGFRHFAVAAYDRGGRFAYRMVLDHPAAVNRPAVLELVPTGP